MTRLLATTEIEVSELSRIGHKLGAHGGAKLGNSGEITFRRTTHDFLCIPGQELASKRTVQSFKRIWVQGGDDTMDRRTVERYVVGIAVHE